MHEETLRVLRTGDVAVEAPPTASSSSHSLSGSSSTKAAAFFAPADWLLFTFGYLLLIEFGLATPMRSATADAYWPASGLLIATLILVPTRRWIYFLLGAAAANLLALLYLQPTSVAFSLVFVAASLVEAIVAASLVRRFFARPFNFRTVNRVVGFAGLAAVLAASCYALLVEGLRPLWAAESFDIHSLYLRWAAHAMGVVTIGSVTINLASDLVWTHQMRLRALGFGFAAATIFLIWYFFGFGPTRRFGLHEIQLPLLVLPILVAAAVFVNRSASLMIAVAASLAAIVTTSSGTDAGDRLASQAFVQQTALHAFVFAAMLWPLIVATAIEEKVLLSLECSRQFEYLQQVMHSSSDSISLKDSNGRYLLVNESAAKLMRTTVDQMLGKRAVDFLPEEMANQLERLEQLAKHRQISETVEEHWNDNGQQRVFIVSRNSWPRSGSAEKGLVIIAREVTEIRRQRMALLHSQQRFQALVDSIPTCIFEADSSGQCRYVNAHWTELSGQAVEEAMNLGWLDAVHEHDREGIQRTWREFHEGKVKSFSREFRLRKPDSSVTWVEVHIGALLDEVGNILGGIGAIMDITPRKYAEENLRESEELFRTLANAAPVMLWRTDTEQKCGFLNDRWLDFIGMELAEAEVDGWNARIHPDDRERRLLVVGQAFAQRSGFEIDYRVLRRDGEYRWVVDSGVPVFDELDQFRGFIGGCIDITERQAARTALQQLNLELEDRVQQRTSALTIANQKLQDEVAVRREILERLEQKQSELAHVSRVTALGEMAAGLAHELKQPLHAIRNYVSGMKMLNRSGDSDSLANVAMAEIDRETHRAASIIDRIRSFAVRSPSSHTPLFLESVIEDSIALMQSEAARRGIKIELASGSESGLKVRGDWIQIQQVLVNLIQNAVDAMEAGKDRSNTVRFNLRAEWPNAIIECRDHGPGIAPEDQTRVFDPFYTKKSTGLGMGLAISRSIIEAHFGKITVLETSSAGTVMAITLPILVDEPDASGDAGKNLTHPDLVSTS
jgi:PAS domain S-box-containing protein